MNPTFSTTTYWQHGDHLGSASWVTDTNGVGYQHLQYMPWGEQWVDQRKTGYSYNTRYTFSGKERDEETGYSYFGARYYHPDLSIWLSVDPMSDKYPSLSPYAYCGNNPVRLVDPDGEEIGDYFNLNGDYLGTDGLDDGKLYIVSDKHWNEIKNTGYVAEDGTTVISSSFTTAEGFSNWFQKPSAADLSGKAVFNIISHYNTTGVKVKLEEGDFAMQTVFTSKAVLHIKINERKWRNYSPVLDNYYNILSTYDHEVGHIDQYNKIGYDKFKSLSTYEKEKYAVDFQKGRSSFQRASSFYQKETDLYSKKQK